MTSPMLPENIFEQRLLAVLDVVQRYLPPDGIDKDAAISEIIGLVDPWPEQSALSNPSAPICGNAYGGPRDEGSAGGERERCAQICEAMRPAGGRAWTEAQNAAYSALTDAAERIRAGGLRPSDCRVQITTICREGKR